MRAAETSPATVYRVFEIIQTFYALLFVNVMYLICFPRLIQKRAEYKLKKCYKNHTKISL